MKKLSLWAKHHKNPARLIIIGSFILLTVAGTATGLSLSGLGISLPLPVLGIAAFIYIAGLIAYPSRSSNNNKRRAAAFYVRQKTCDLLLAATTFCMIVFFSNRPDQLFLYTAPLNAALPAASEMPKDSSIRTYKPIAAFSASLKDENGKSLKWKEKRKLLKEQIRAIRKDKEMSNGAKVGLIILSVLVAIGLLIGIGALACNLSCSGAEGAATLVMIGGVGLVVFLLVVAIRAITKKNKEAKPTSSGPDIPVKEPKKE